jgi:hypothetical protein
MQVLALPDIAVFVRHLDPLVRWYYLIKTLHCTGYVLVILPCLKNTNVFASLIEHSFTHLTPFNSSYLKCSHSLLLIKY